MIDVTEINTNAIQAGSRDGSIYLLGYSIHVRFVLFEKIYCECNFEVGHQDELGDIKTYIESLLKEDFNSLFAQQLEGKPSNLKTK